MKTIIQELGEYNNNHLWIKREDLIPFSFGGNKARKAQIFFNEIDKGNYDCVVTYGSSSSNHCRIIANQCCKRNMMCYIISPEELFEETFNSQMMKMFGAKIITVPVSDVHHKIEEEMAKLSSLGKKPYFIEGGGHGNFGTEAYVQCYEEIKEYEVEMGVKFEYIFHASGTGTTQAGLICGQLLNHDKKKIIGISIARKNPRGRDIILDSIRSYLDEKYNEGIDESIIESNTFFVDEFTEGYGEKDKNVYDMIDLMLKKYGIPLDSTYTGKAFWGMTKYLERVCGKNVLFIHTGGTPLFFDYLSR